METCMIIYIYIYIHTHIQIYVVRENKIVLVTLSEGTTGGGREREMLDNENC
jgi:hypothetical protein